MARALEQEKSKKRKRADIADEPEHAVAEEPAPLSKEESGPKEGGKKKRRKTEKTHDPEEKEGGSEGPAKAAGSAGAEEEADEQEDGGRAQGKKNRKKRKGSEGEKKDRHIVFVGNLPYTATTDSIRQHFKVLPPMSIRCLNDPKDQKKCRGIAFLDFATAAEQRKALDSYHHSEFNDGKSAPRQINIELTAGGGGRTEARKEKIKAKNAKLALNRTKLAMKAELAQGVKSREQREKAAVGGPKPRPRDSGNVHPSRRRVVGKR